GFWQVGIDTVATVSFSTGWVASRIFRLNLGVNIAVLSQLGTRNIHVPGLAISINGRGVVLAIDRHGDGVTSLDVLTNRTGDGHVGFGLSLVDHVVTGNGGDRDGGFGQIGINVVWALCVGGSGVACFVFSCNLGFNFSVTKQVYAWNIQVPSFAVGINRRGELFAADSDGDGVTCFNVFTNRTGDDHVGFRFSLVDDVIFSNHVNSDVGL